MCDAVTQSALQMAALAAPAKEGLSQCHLRFISRMRNCVRTRPYLGRGDKQKRACKFLLMDNGALWVDNRHPATPVTKQLPHLPSR